MAIKMRQEKEYGGLALMCTCDRSERSCNMQVTDALMLNWKMGKGSYQSKKGKLLKIKKQTSEAPHVELFTCILSNVMNILQSIVVLQDRFCP